MYIFEKFCTVGIVKKRWEVILAYVPDRKKWIKINNLAIS